MTQPPANPSDRGKKLGKGQKFDCPECDGTVKAVRGDGEKIPRFGWHNFILATDEDSIMLTVECTECDWDKVKTIVVREA